MRLAIAGYDVPTLLRKTVGEIVDDNVLGLASETAWSMFFGIFPALLFAAPLLAIIGNQEQVFDFLLGQLATVVPPDAMALVRGILRDVVFTAGAPGLISIGAIGALWAGAGMFSSLMGALNVAFDVRETRPWWRQKLIAIACAIGAVIVGWIATIIFVAGQDVVLVATRLLHLGPAGATIWTILQYPVALALIVVLIWLLYLVLPDLPDHPRRVTLVGAAVATVLWLAVTTGFRLYVAHFGSYNKTYGTIGAVIILLTWMYLSMFAVLAGGELASTIRAGVGRS